MKYIILLILTIVCFSCTVTIQEPSDNRIDLTSFSTPNYNIGWENEKIIKLYKSLYYKKYNTTDISLDMLLLSIPLLLSNVIEYKYDTDSQGTENYWQTPLQTLTLRTGDCEDRAILMMYIMVEYFKIDKNLITIVAAEVPKQGWHMYLNYSCNTPVDSRIYTNDKWLTFGGELDTNTTVYTYDQALKIAEYTHNPDLAKF